MSSKSRLSSFAAMLGFFVLVTALGLVQAQSAKQFAQTPLSFEANAGQIDRQVEYLSRGAGYTVFLAPGEAVVRLKAAHGNADGAVRIALEGVRTAKGEPEAQQATRTNYLIGSRPENWRTGVENFGRVRYRDVWPGVDVVYYGNQRRLEHDFVVAPGADLSRVRMHLEGAQSMHVDAADGDLVLEMAGGRSVRLERPVTYQERDGRREPVESRYVLAANGRVGFAIGSYDRKRALVIDPVLSYSTYLGGSVADQVQAIAVDATGAVYVAGESASIDFPLVSAYQKTNKPAATGATSAFVAKINPAGTALVWSTYLGGSGVTQTGNSYSYGKAACGVYTSTSAGITWTCGDAASGIAVDASSNVYVTGLAHSTDFPVVNAYQKTNAAAANYGTNVFVAKLNAAGSALTWSTYLGGSGVAAGYGDTASAIALDASDNVYITGAAASPNFPVVSAIQAHNFESSSSYSGPTAFVTKINAAGSALVYSTYLGGSDAYNSDSQFGDQGQTIAVDAAGEAYVGGITAASDFPVVNAIQPVNNAYPWGTENGFVVKLNAAGTALEWSTYLGGTGNSNGAGDGVLGLALDASGNAYVTGYAGSGDFPLVTPYQSKNQAEQFGGGNAFVTKILSSGSAIAWSTYLGGPMAVADSESNGLSGDGGTAIALDKSGNVYVAGFTQSSSFPLASALETTNVAANHGEKNAFVSELNAAGSALLFSTYWGGQGSSCNYENESCSTGNDLLQVAGDTAQALAVDASGNIYVGGTAQSTDFPTYKALQPGMKAGALENGFVAKFAPGTATLAATELTLSSSNSTVIVGSKVTFTARVVELTGTTTPTGTVSFTVDSVALGTATLNAYGYASLSTTTLVVGKHQVIAGYAGDTKNQSSSGEIEQTVEYPAPVFSVAGGTYATAPKVTVTDTATGVTIYYTLTEPQCSNCGGGTTPTSSSTKYTAAVPIGTGGAWYLEAIAIDAKGNTSPVTSAEYMTASAPPTITPATGTASSGTFVTITAPSGQNGYIYYTTDGTAATTSSNSLYDGGSIYPAITSTTTIHAIFVNSNCYGQSWCNSAQATSVITINPAPVFSVAGGTYTTPQSVKITDTGTGVTIYYTLTSGYATTPTATSTKYTAPVTVTEGGDWFLSAVAIDAKGNTSAVTSAEYLVASAPPTITPVTGAYVSGTTVTLAAPSGVSGYIYYTTDGTSATTSSNYYYSALTITSTTTIHAIFVNSNCYGYTWCNSAQATAVITIEPQVPAPTIASYTSSTIASGFQITDSLSTATIYYTTNGTTPTASSTKYAGPVALVAGTTVIKAIAVATSEVNSAVSTSTFTITSTARAPRLGVAAR